MIKIKIDLEKILLALFFAFILFVSLGSLFNHNIKHEFPFAYFASDAFQHQVRAEAIKDMGNFKYEAAYISKGIEGIEGIFVSKRDISSFSKTTKYIVENYKEIQKKMEKNILPSKKDMIKQISDIIKTENY